VSIPPIGYVLAMRCRRGGRGRRRDPETGGRLVTRETLIAACRAADRAAREHHRTPSGAGGAAVGYARIGEVADRMSMDFRALMAFAENRCVPLMHVIERQGLGLSRAGRSIVIQALIAAWVDGVEVGRGYNRQPDAAPRRRWLAHLFGGRR
jgi:hypothetical protein